MSVRKKVDPRVKMMIENGIKLNHRTFFILIGDRGKDQVVKLHYMLAKSIVGTQPSVLWCYKKELGFSSHKKKRMKKIQKKAKQGPADPEKDDPFELFLTATNIRWTYYKETHKVLGNTFGMCVLQDFEAITPNILARTLETVQGGGLIVLLLKTMTSLRQLYTMAMDIHSRFRTEAHKDIAPRFNERFLLSLVSCKQSLIMDDELNILPISLSSREITPEPPTRTGDETKEERELRELKESLADTDIISSLIQKAKTLDQAKAIVTFVEAISEKTLRSTVALTASRGRGKSAALGLSIAAAVAFGYSNIFVTSPTPENLKTLFDFIFIGFDALGYQEHTDYELIQSTNPDFNKAIVRVNVFRSHRQVIQYITPTDSVKLGQAELVVIDEAAAIPLPFVKALLGPYLVFMASTVNGYEGTGRSLSLKLIKELRDQSGSSTTDVGSGGRVLREVTLNDPIRYSSGDSVEQWLNGLLCLDASNVKPLSVGCPHPSKCELFYVNRDTLFSYHKVSEEFLQRMMSLYVSSHYKNSPNDLMLMSDAPAHHMFVLLPPIDENTKSLPEVLCVVQIALEGEISKELVASAASRSKRPDGDLIPWNVSMQYQDDNFPTLSGARVVRIATHPDFQSMGYGTRALQLLQDYFEGKMTNLAEEQHPKQDSKRGGAEDVDGTDELHTEKIKPKKHLPPLLSKLSERPPERLQWLGVSYGLTPSLFGFWRKAGYSPVYIRLTELDITGEHTCIMLKALEPVYQSEVQYSTTWLSSFYDDFTSRFLSLLGFQFRKFTCKNALAIISTQRKFNEILDGKSKSITGRINKKDFTKRDLDSILSVYDIKRLESYTKNLLDYHAIIDLLPQICRLYFVTYLSDKINLTQVQYCILIGLGLQYKTVDVVSSELTIQPNQVLALFNKSLRKLVKFFNELEEKEDEKALISTTTTSNTTSGAPIEMNPTAMTLDEDLDDAEIDTKKLLKEKQDNLLKTLAKPEFAIQGDNEAWEEGTLELKRSKVPNIVSIKRKKSDKDDDASEQPKKKRKKNKSN
eukprot:TRINITY_DN3550_c0_g1_i1.p1 TRINITY_DN3550_c0_g1~~TRINITY_DN3550_c0_g1_i1.p1  ORF type:complete len:1035 (-),score=287.65 TRINITY_DN3550_c0_g1_i1:40-3144(-)